MKTRLFPWLPGVTLAGLLTLAGAGVLGFAPAAHEERGAKSLEGTWINEVKAVTCPPAPPMVLARFQGMFTFMRGGTLIEGGGPSGAPPAVWRSAGHGIWKRTGRHRYRAFFRFHSFDDLGRLVRITEVTIHPRLIGGDNPETPDVVEPYYLRGEGGTNTITNINPDDGTVINVTKGCGELTSRPVLFDD